MKWRVLGASTTGANHLRSGLPNQDALAWSSRADEAALVVVAVSDGHGSPKCFRSDIGGQLAVQVATRVIAEFAAAHAGNKSLAQIREAADSLPMDLVLAWRQAVDNALDSAALSSEELTSLEAQLGTSAREAVQDNPLLAYGATLLAVLVAPFFVLYLQIGDGDILAVSDKGQVTRPLPSDERLFANETTSLCLEDAWRTSRLEVRNLMISAPALILLSTDGYANSFGNDAGFMAVGSDLLNIIKSDGLDTVRENLETWLAETSKAGSGDDVTLALICRQDVDGPVII